MGRVPSSETWGCCAAEDEEGPDLVVEVEVEELEGPALALPLEAALAAVRRVDAADAIFLESKASL